MFTTEPTLFDAFVTALGEVTDLLETTMLTVGAVVPAAMIVVLL